MNQERELQNPWLMLACAWLMGFAMYAPMLSVPPIIHILMREIHMTHAQAGLIFAAPLMMLAAFAIPSGALADRIGIRKAAGIGIIIIIIGSFLRGTASNFETLLAFTCIYGAGFGMVYPNLPKIVGTWFPPEKIGLATGIYATGIYSGCAIPLSLTLSTVLPVTNTFQGVFYIWSIPAIVVAVMWWIVVKEPDYGSVHSKQISEGDKSSHRIWTNRAVWTVAILSFCENAIFYSWSGWTPTLMMMKGGSPDLGALMTSVIVWMGIPIVLLMPSVSSKVGLRKPFVWGSTIILGLTAWGAIFSSLSSGWLIVAALGLANNTFFVMLLIFVAELVPPQDIGRASGMQLTLGYIGGLLGPWVAGYIMDITGTLDLHFIILIGLSAVATCFAFTLPETGLKAKAISRKVAPLNRT
jgi:cyanate permease